jgi:hypothetical protein
MSGIPAIFSRIAKNPEKQPGGVPGPARLQKKWRRPSFLWPVRGRFADCPYEHLIARSGG